MDTDDPLERDLSPGARRQRVYRERQKKYARVATVEVGMETVTVLVARGYLRDGDASQLGLNLACQKALEALGLKPHAAKGSTPRGRCRATA